MELEIVPEQNYDYISLYGMWSRGAVIKHTFDLAVFGGPRSAVLACLCAGEKGR